MNDFMDAAAAGVLARIPCHPLDTIKTVSFAGHYSSTQSSQSAAEVGKARSRSTYRWIVQSDGFRGLWRGVGIAVAGAAPGNALYLVSYETFKHSLTLSSSPPSDSSPSALRNAFCWVQRFAAYLLCGILAEACGCVVWVPVDVAKERMQCQPAALQGRYRNSWDAVRTILRNEGLRGCYRGYFSTLASFGPFSGVYFMSLEGCYEVHHWLRWKKWIPSMSTFTESLLCAAIANIIASFVTNPFELVKTRLQVQRAVLTVEGRQRVSNQYAFQYKGMRDGLRMIFREEGLMGLWRGVSARIIYAVPNASLTMALFKTFQERHRAKQS